MVRKQKPLPEYKSATAGLGNAVSEANRLDAEGYDVKFCFAVVVTDFTKEPPENTQGIWLLAKRKDLK